MKSKFENNRHAVLYENQLANYSHTREMPLSVCKPAVSHLHRYTEKHSRMNMRITHFQIADAGPCAMRGLVVRLKSFFRKNLRDVDFYRFARGKREKARRSGGTVKKICVM